MKQSHTGFNVCESGLLINHEWPWIGATPDGVVSCTCCHIQYKLQVTTKKNILMVNCIWIMHMFTNTKSRHSRL